MEGLDLLHVELWHPFAYVGLHHPFFAVNADTIINTWILLGILLIAVLPVRWILRRQNSVLRFMILTGIQSFIVLVRQALGTFSFRHFCFVIALFIFIATANCMMLVPFLDEPTTDLNTTLALGIITFVYIQAYAIRAHGLVEYLKEYFTPFFVMFPLHVVGKLASIVSMSFRLFGNIFGGATIAHIAFAAFKGTLFLELVGLLSGINMVILLFFGLFEGLLQAFVFTMLALTYLSIALQHDEFEAKEHS